MIARVLMAAFLWVATPANLIGASVVGGSAVVVGYLKGHAVAKRDGDVRVALAVRAIVNRLHEEETNRVDQADAAAAGIAPTPAGPGNRPDRARIERLCRADPACRRDGS